MSPLREICAKANFIDWGMVVFLTNQFQNMKGNSKGQDSNFNIKQATRELNLWPHVPT